VESVIYRALKPEVAASCGYFTPKAPFAPLDACSPATVDLDFCDQILYYPGSFGTFHEGHISVCEAAFKKYPNARLVVAPSNSDYTAQKYGAWSENASNKHRYDQIKRMMPDAIIDHEPMLNFACDHNFTDQLSNFLEVQGLHLDSMVRTPVILCGKDREDFLGLNAHTYDIKVEHFEDTTGFSTSALPNKQRAKKHLWLRCTTQKEYWLFKEYFADQYKVISPFFLDDELELVNLILPGYGVTHTICKEYAHLLPYIKLSRTFTNPLEDPTFPDRDERILPGMKILDSDIYSGATRDFIVDKCGASMVAMMNLETMQETHELLDISDFRKPDFCYPYVDISSRCSMQAFDYDFHKRFAAFKEALSCLK
jgi:cytidyltransferase-like protein